MPAPAAGITFIGPTADTMRLLGDKVSARNLAVSVGVPVMPASDPLPDDIDEAKKIAADIGYPLMLKASWGGGGRGMRVIPDEATLARDLTAARREAKAAFGKDDVYLEKLVERARHVEVQILADGHGSIVHLFERDCTVQRRHQKVVERAPAPYLDDEKRHELCTYAIQIAHAAKYKGAGTVEFLMDADTGAIYFIEVNPRIQVEHTVTEEVTGIDIVKAQIRFAEGAAIGDKEPGCVPRQGDIHLNGHALQCRITTEDPEQNFIPDYGRITAYRGATGFGIRLDGGTAYSGAVITRFYDPLLEKVTAWAPTPGEAIARMNRALREFRIRGVATNLTFLENVINHPAVPRRQLHHALHRRDAGAVPVGAPARPRHQAADLHRRRHRQRPSRTRKNRPRRRTRRRCWCRRRPSASIRRRAPSSGSTPTGRRPSPRGCAPRSGALVTDTTMRDAHQSLLATRMRTHDLVEIAPAYAAALPQLLSLECWGGATFDVAMRFLAEDPWERLADIREKTPNILLQMLLRGSNAVGYANYPDNVVKFFVRQAADAGVDLFRVFDCLNWVENMRVSMEAVVEAGKLCEGAMCYTGDILDPARAKYDLKYYVNLAHELEKAGAHIIGIKDMAGLLKPAAARILVDGAPPGDRPADPSPHPRHLGRVGGLGAGGGGGRRRRLRRGDRFHVGAHLAALPRLAGRGAARIPTRDTGLDPEAIRKISFYFEKVRGQYLAFESDLRFGASEVYLHEMPGGQFTNLKEQARSLGLEARWHEVARAYADVNMMFGDIVKVTPSSKVVGDLALMMVAGDLTPADVLDPDRDIAFPGSVVQMMRGDLGQPPGGWPEELQKKVLKGDDADHGASGLAAAAGRSRGRAQGGGGEDRRGGRRPRRSPPT